MRVLVTGAEGFVGRTMVRTLLAAGHDVWAGIRSGGPLEVPGLTPAERAAVTRTPLELLDTASVDSVVECRPDAVVHLAAIASGADARRDVGVAWAVNAAGTARVADALGRLRERGEADPVMLLVSSGEVYGGGVDRPRREDDALVPCSPYAASKGAVVQMTKTLGLELAAWNITVNAICPGPFLTPMNVPIAETEDAKKNVVGAVAFNRWGRMEGIQGAAIFLASDASSYMTGSLVTVDGGWTAR